MSSATLLRDELWPAVGRVRRAGSFAGRQVQRDTAPEIVLDLSRLLSRVLHPTPTGVDRVEMAYAQGLLRLAPERLSFAAVHPSGGYGRLPSIVVRPFLDATQARWETRGGGEGEVRRWSRALLTALLVSPLQARPRRREAGRAYLHLSARALERSRMFQGLLRREGAAFVPFVHDLIPLEFPEYARPNGADLYRRKIETVVRFAAGVLVNSAATGRALQPYLDRAGRGHVPVRVAPLGVERRLGADPSDAEGDPRVEPPYFVALGTIEPRKNHLLLLNLWRRMVETQGVAATPRLVLIGRRGWENENILDLLDRSAALRGAVVERSGLADCEVRALVAGARAVLLPSFAEGYGLPVVEALSLGTPVIASDLAALREAGGSAPEYLDALDGPAWSRAILDYATPASPRRQAQIARIGQWRAPSWDDPVRVALQLVDEVTA